MVNEPSVFDYITVYIYDAKWLIIQKERCNCGLDKDRTYKLYPNVGLKDENIDWLVNDKKNYFMLSTKQQNRASWISTSQNLLNNQGDVRILETENGCCPVNDVP